MPYPSAAAALVLAAAAALLAARPAPAQELDAAMPSVQPEVLRRSLVSMGDNARLLRVLDRARRGRPIVVGVIGGSITAGAGASREEFRYGNRVARWWRETFPGAPITFVNAGIGATGSDIGAHRVRRHLLERRPDFVVAEYAVNDPNTPAAAETLEGIVRQVLALPNRPAMMLLFTMNRAGGNSQEQHGRVGRHYGLPMVSFRDAMWPEIEAGRVRWEDVEADEVHPNDRGHALCALFIESALKRALAALPAPGAPLPRVAAHPAPLLSDTYQHTAMLSADTVTAVRADGWSVADGTPWFGRSWTADQPGATLELDLEGTAFSVVFYRVKGPMGRAEATVDDGPPATLEAWFNADWGGYDACQLVARGLKPGRHRLRIRLLEEHAPASQGTRFEVRAVLAAGLPPAARR